MKIMLLAAFIAFVAVPGTAVTDDPVSCTGTCEIGSFGGGYIMPVASITSGSSVVWTSLDVNHVQAQSPVASLSTCIHVSASPISPSPPVQFDLVAGALYATTNPDDEEAEAKECRNTNALADGSHALLYYCTLHPNMHAEIVVS